MSTIQPRVVKTRDAATSILRKLGLKPPAYGTFMMQLPDGRWEINLPKLYEQGYGVNLKGNTKPAKAPKELKVKSAKPAKVLKAAKEPKPAKVPRVSCSSVARDLILAGKTNEEVWVALKEQFKLSDDKRHYPTWYRCQLNRAGKLATK